MAFGVNSNLARLPVKLVLDYLTVGEAPLRAKKRKRQSSDSSEASTFEPNVRGQRNPVAAALRFVFQTRIVESTSYDVKIHSSVFATRLLTQFLNVQQQKTVNQGTTYEDINSLALNLQGTNSILDRLWDYRWFPGYAVHGYFRGVLTVDQVASISFLYLAITQFGRNEIRRYSIHEKRDLIGAFFALNDTEVSQMITHLESKPSSEHYYYVIPLRGRTRESRRKVEKILQDSGIGHLVTVELSTKLQQLAVLVPSMSMFSALIKEFYGNAVKLAPFFGQASPEQIMHLKCAHLHPLQLGMPEAPISIGEGDKRGPFGHVLSNIYQALRRAEMRKGVKAITHIIQCVLVGRLKKTSQQIVRLLLDGRYLCRVGQPFGELLLSKHIPWHNTHIVEIFRNMALLSKFWEQEFGITDQSLWPCQRQAYAQIKASVTATQQQWAEKALFGFYKDTASGADPSRHFRLGCMYAAGFGTKVSYLKANAQWQIAGTPAAFYKLGQSAEYGLGKAPCIGEALENYKKAQGVPGAQFALGRMRYLGVMNFVPQNQPVAFAHFLTAAQKSHMRAMYCVGMMLMKEKGTNLTAQTAFSYLKRAADRGLCEAQCQVGECYLKKMGIERDLEKARLYFSRAAKQGSELAEQRVNQIDLAILSGSLLPIGVVI